MPLQVLHVLDHSMPIMSGYAVRSRDIVTAQARLGMKPMVITGPLHELDDTEAQDIVVDDVSYCRTPLAGFGSAVLRRRLPVARELATVRLFQRRIEQVLRERRFDIIHAHSPSLCGLAALRAADRVHIPLVYEIRAFWEDAAVDQNKTAPRSLRYRLSRGLEQHVCRRAAAVIGISRHITSTLKDRGIAGQKVFHVPNGVDTTRFVPPAADRSLARELGLGGEVVFGFIGSMYRYEGLPWLVRAAAELHQRVPNCRFILVGSGEDRHGVEQAVAETKSASFVHVLGPVPHDQVTRYYSVMDVMVYPRRSIRLTELVTPLKPLEAMAQGRVVLGSNVGGIRELVRSEETGLLFGTDDVGDFCRQATRLISEPQLRVTLSHAGRQYVVAEKDWQWLAKRYLKIYEFALARRALAQIVN